ncbi:MAG: methylmalonyl Co-A mutase-associated GTPase MeaB [Bacteroidales bacterium]|nr:methylmalonyl Co-A mutase-associated GTPase MeaB [Bacteroidales bacterium]
MDDKHLYSNFDYDSALNVKDGVPQPQQVSSDYAARLRIRKREEPAADALVEGILRHDRTLLSRAITLVESTLPAHRRKAQQVIEACLPHSGRSIRLGITGVPGAGKSTLIESLGTMLTAAGHRVAVLAIDPSSERSHGSILGDKTRMESLSTDPNAFIRPSPSAGSLGGVARKTREIITLCEAAGFDIVIVETVGVGQSEVLAHSMVDFFLLLQLANAGDELQGIKRGIMEMADMIAINKCEINPQQSQLAATQLRNALHLFPMPDSGWPPKVLLCSAYTSQGIADLWHEVSDYIAFTQANGYFDQKRRQQNLRILTDTLESALRDRFYATPGIETRLESLRADILANKITPYAAAELLLDAPAAQ